MAEAMVQNSSAVACSRPRSPLVWLCGGLVLAVIVLLMSGCGRNAYVPPPPPVVIVGTAEQYPVTIYHEYTGNTEASKSVQVRSRVSGYLEKINFQDGAIVSEGQLLFVIDPRPYRALVDQAKAQLEGRRAAAVQAQAVYNRTLASYKLRAVTAEQVEIDRGSHLVAQAAVMQAQAALEQAQVNLDYTEIHAPISGHIGRRMVDVGNLVTADSTLLTIILKYDPMYAYFNVSEANYLAYLKRQRAKPRAEKPETPLAKPQERPRPLVELGLANESSYPHRGTIDFAEPTVDPNTGTLLLRGVFPNPEPYRLAPGLFVRLRVPIDTQPNALLVPDSALGTDQAGRYLLVVPPNNIVERRAVTVGTLVGDRRVIEQGLEPSERFIVEGLQQARPGAEVTVKEG